VDDAPDLFFALEVQTRSIYPGSSFTDPVDGDLLVVHENAHQWFGDSVALAEWKHMWLNEVGDQDSFRILRAWAAKKAGGNGTTGQFIALAERISGEQLDNLFDVWLFTAGKPTSAAATGTTALAPRTATGKPLTPPAAASLLQRMSNGASHLRR
jgi:aminopeptidase N